MKYSKKQIKYFIEYYKYFIKSRNIVSNYYKVNKKSINIYNFYIDGNRKRHDFFIIKLFFLINDELTLIYLYIYKNNIIQYYWYLISNYCYDLNINNYNKKKLIKNCSGNLHYDYKYSYTYTKFFKFYVILKHTKIKNKYIVFYLINGGNVSIYFYNNNYKIYKYYISCYKNMLYSHHKLNIKFYIYSYFLKLII